jgi:hypothetical protein
MGKLKPNQVQAAILLVSGKSSKDVASAINCTPESITHWKKIPEFEALLNQLRKELIENGRELLRDSIKKAVSTLQDLMVNADSDEVKRKAAVDVLRMNGFDADIETAKFRFMWGIGMTTTDGVLNEQKSVADLAKLLKGISP